MNDLWPYHHFPKMNGGRSRSQRNIRCMALEDVLISCTNVVLFIIHIEVEFAYIVVYIVSCGIEHISVCSAPCCFVFLCLVAVNCICESFKWACIAWFASHYESAFSQSVFIQQETFCLGTNLGKTPYTATQVHESLTRELFLLYNY